MILRVLDTDTLTLIEEGHAAVIQHVRAAAPNSLGITVFTVEEQLPGWYARVRKAKKPEQIVVVYGKLAQSVRFLSTWLILDYTGAAVQRYKAASEAEDQDRED